MWDVPEDDLDDDEIDDFAVSPLLGPPLDEATVAAQNALWEAFEGAEYEAQIAQFQEALKGDALDADLAFEMLAEIQAEAQARGDLAGFDALLEQFAREAPGFYQTDGAYYARLGRRERAGEREPVPAAGRPGAVRGGPGGRLRGAVPGCRSTPVLRPDGSLTGHAAPRLEAHETMPRSSWRMPSRPTPTSWST